MLYYKGGVCNISHPEKKSIASPVRTSIALRCKCSQRELPRNSTKMTPVFRTVSCLISTSEMCFKLKEIECVALRMCRFFGAYITNCTYCDIFRMAECTW